MLLAREAQEGKILSHSATVMLKLRIKSLNLIACSTSNVTNRRRSWGRGGEGRGGGGGRVKGRREK